MDLAVRLRNLEYDLTLSIQKVVYGFQSLESVLARLPQDAHFTAFITRESLPQGFEALSERIESVAKEVEGRRAQAPGGRVAQDRGLGERGAVSATRRATASLNTSYQ